MYIYIHILEYCYSEIHISYIHFCQKLLCIAVRYLLHLPLQAAAADLITGGSTTFQLREVHHVHELLGHDFRTTQWLTYLDLPKFSAWLSS